MTYHIIIDEEQRELIEEALVILQTQHFRTPDLDILVSMVAELPEVEKENPRTIHGLCL